MRLGVWAKYSIIVPALVDNIAPAQPLAANVTNHIAIRHAWTYANPDAAVKSGIAYNRTRSDAYEIDVRISPFGEADGWVRLASATPVGGVWVYNMERVDDNTPLASPRSRNAELGKWVIDFSFLGVPGNDLMNRHSIIGGPAAGPTGNLFRVPCDLLVCRVGVSARLAGGANTDINLWQGPAIHPNWAAGVDLVLPLGLTNAIYYDPEGLSAGGGGTIQYYKDDLIQVELAPLGLAPTDLTVIVSGRKTGNI